MRPRRVIVTGASGRIGRAIYVRLAPNYDVVGLDRIPSPTTQVVGDLCDPAFVSRVVKGAYAVIHAAALHAPHVGHHPDQEFLRVNVEATLGLLNAAIEHGVSRFVFTSTSALYGAACHRADGAAWITEETPPQPVTVYHRTKLAAEELLEAAAGRGDIAIRILRMSRCFPEPAPLMAAYRLHRGVDARDVAEAHALCLADAGPKFLRLIISGETPFLPADCEELGRNAPAVIERRAPDLARAFAEKGWALPARIDRVYDARRAADALGWRATRGFQSVLAQLERGSAEVLPPHRGGEHRVTGRA